MINAMLIGEIFHINFLTCLSGSELTDFGLKVNRSCKKSFHHL